MVLGGTSPPGQPISPGANPFENARSRQSAQCARVDALTSRILGAQDRLTLGKLHKLARGAVVALLLSAYTHIYLYTYYRI